MKSIRPFRVLLALSIFHAQTSTQAQDNNATLPPPTPYSVASLDANSTVWQRTTYDQAPDGSIVPYIHQYTELATGLNFRNPQTGQWQASQVEIEISPDGSSASATNGQHQVYFPGNIYSGNIRLVTPDGQTLQSEPVGLSYFDGTNSVLLAMLTNSIGAILPAGNQVIYTNAFAGLNADLLYTYTKAGFEQDVILREQPPDPGTLGLNPATTRIQVLTEFVTAPQPSVTATTVPTAAGNLEDDSLGFGAMAMGHGKAFLIDGNSPSAGVEKRWAELNGRQFLIEEVPIVSIATAIDTLTPYVAQAGVGTKAIVSQNLILPPQRQTTTTPKTKFIAQAELPSRGLVLDWAMTMFSATNYTFQGDMTYYISGVVNLAGTNTFEGGTSLKYATNGTVNIAGINCQTAPYRPVYFTGKDDDRTGDWVNGTTHNPNTFYANPALTINASGQTLSNFRIAYAQQAIATTAGSESFYNGQFVNCLFGLTASGTTNFLRNVLFANVTTNFNNLSSALVDVQNGSFGPSAYLASVGSGVSIIVTNSVLAYVTNLYSGSPTLSTGAYNGFFNTTEFGASANTNNFYPFQTAGAGGYYLASGCAFTNIGSANIDPILLAGLTNLTVYPPTIFSNVPITNLTFGMQAQRDTNAAPDLGYHYAPIDYFFGGCTASSNITFTAGTAAGWFDLPGFNNAPGWGISLQGQIIVAFNGTVTAPCIWARYETVQEGGNGLWVAKDYVGGLASAQGNSYNISQAPQIVANFTHFAEMWQDPNHFRDYYTPLIAIVKNSEFWCGSVGAYNNSCYFTNCFGDRMVAYQVQGYNPANAFITRNCTWHGGLVYFTPNNNPITLSVRDCAFEGSAFTIQNYGTNGDYDYNAFTNGAAQLPNGGTHNITNIVSYNWQTSWFGSFYLPSNSSLTNAGDVLASQEGLYHFTILTNQVPEGTNTVSIGYHYVATDTYGNPLDSNGDGIPDYLEDANGNGIFDTGDLGDWQGLNLNVIITRPRNGSILP